MIVAPRPLYVCFDCSATCAPSANRVRCDCGGLLDLPLIGPEIRTDDDISPVQPRYWAADWALRRASLGEACTPLLRWSDSENVWLKCDHLLPTGSFKDRGAHSVVARALELGVAEVVVDSSGNAGAALAGYAARAGITCVVYVPRETSVAKVAQIRSYGAVVRLVDGPREMSEAAALAYAFDRKAMYAGHATSPYFHDGTKSWFYEVLRQLPLVEVVVLPVGSGSLLLGLVRAIDELTSIGCMSVSPKVIVAQAEGFASLGGPGDVGSPSVESREHPIAEGIAIQRPARRGQLRHVLGRVNSVVSIVTSREIIAAQSELARAGFYVEPTSAAAWAAWRNSGSASATVVALTGHGLKIAA